LITHPDVTDAGVVGVEVNGLELPRAYIVLRKPTKDVTAQHLVAKEVQEWVKPRVGKPKHLRGGVIVIPEIPKRLVICAVAIFYELEPDTRLFLFSPAGKILRRVLRERAAKEVLEVSERFRAVSTRL
jgi:acyl-coenzyme A synthetase/AMP-(fatty) acid ligase